MAKKQIYTNTNEFLNHLSNDEFTEFIQSRDIPIDKLTDTGRISELSTIDLGKESAIDLKE
jgi:hypothetical protein